VFSGSSSTMTCLQRLAGNVSGWVGWTMWWWIKWLNWWHWHWHSFVIDSIWQQYQVQDRKANFLEREFAARKFPSLKSRLVSFNEPFLSFSMLIVLCKFGLGVPSLHHSVAVGQHTFGPTPWLPGRRLFALVLRLWAPGRKLRSMWLTALTTQAKESVGHLDLVAIWLWPKICRTDLGFSVPACNLDLGQLYLNWTDRFHTVTRSVYWLELDLPRISRFHHWSLRHHSEVRSCRWDQNPTEFAGDPGVHRPSPGAFGDLEVFFGRWLEGFRYLPDRVVVNPTQSLTVYFQITSC
jgi:hypothetical protein